MREGNSLQSSDCFLQYPERCHRVPCCAMARNQMGFLQIVHSMPETTVAVAFTNFIGQIAVISQPEVEKEKLMPTMIDTSRRLWKS